MGSINSFLAILTFVFLLRTSAMPSKLAIALGLSSVEVCSEQIAVRKGEPSAQNKDVAGKASDAGIMTD